MAYGTYCRFDSYDLDTLDGGPGVPEKINRLGGLDNL